MLQQQSADSRVVKNGFVFINKTKHLLLISLNEFIVLQKNN